MTPSILNWLATRVAKEFAERRPKRVLEVGSLDINGSARQPLQKYAGTYLGIDRQQGLGVDWVGEISTLDPRKAGGFFDAIIATEALEHDPYFWGTLQHMHRLSQSPALWVVTTPANGFPYHGHPRDYYRFTEDAYQDVIFRGGKILDLRTVDGGGHEKAVCGMAVFGEE